MGCSVTAAETAVATLLRELGEDPERAGLAETPARAVRALRELTGGRDIDPAALLATSFEAQADQMIVVRGIEFWSLCEHHLLPFHGVATVGYLPAAGQVVGLSKLPRLVQAFARRLQLQERLCQQIADTLMLHLAPLGAGVLLEAQHLCMAARGVRQNATMMTSCLRGVFREAPVRGEFLALAGHMA
jgi:GTP cyclohydrolase I